MTSGINAGRTGKSAFTYLKPIRCLQHIFIRSRCNPASGYLCRFAARPWIFTGCWPRAGIELNALAVDELFAELGLTPEIRQAGALRHYHAANIDIFQGDFFALEAATLGKVEAVYDRAALIALPSEMRQRYSQHLIQVTHAAPQLLISFHYDQSLVQGPPFNVDASELTALYDQHYEISLLADNHLPTGLKGQHPAQEKVWRLTPLK